ncbi:hypothetical protein, partial [Serratia marcescens]|uniref:hypothetical protein n=1 Tax=Serratia marcescens TaxID=615 RepID=UPI0013DC2FB1
MLNIGKGSLGCRQPDGIRAMNSTATSGHRLPTQYFLAAACVLAAILLMMVGEHIDRRQRRAVDRASAGIVSI